MDCVDPRVTRPRIPFTAAAGALSIATDSAGDADCERLPVIATFPAYDFTIKIGATRWRLTICRAMSSPAGLLMILQY